MLQTSFFKFFSGTVLLFECGCDHPALRVIRNIMNNEKTFKNWNWRLQSSKIELSKNFNFFIFRSSDVPPLSGISTSIKPIDVKILPASIYSRSSSIRKWIQIEIWTHGGSFISRFKSLTIDLSMSKFWTKMIPRS